MAPRHVGGIVRWCMGCMGYVHSKGFDVHRWRTRKWDVGFGFRVRFRRVMAFVALQINNFFNNRGYGRRGRHELNVLVVQDVVGVV